MKTSNHCTVPIRKANGEFARFEISATLIADASGLVERHDVYFNLTGEERPINLEYVVLSRARPEGVRNAIANMRNAANGEGVRRSAILVCRMGVNEFLVVDGNSTTIVAVAAGWSAIPANLISES
jgi:hypothetical protein